ncbi:MAG: cation transporting ATPase C-terminal domain-containing protein, partial [Candidatus Accumulibacter sp.]|nr:cation transporting ATPase C-terminal domain-containing protein [Accumulibacter sp.]
SPILNGELALRIAMVGVMLLGGAFGLFEWALLRGASEEQARTIAVNVFAVGQSFYLLNCRSLRWSMFHLGLLSNPWIWAGIGTMMLAQLAFTYLPLFNRLFHTAPIAAFDWLPISAVGLTIYLAMELEKTYRRRSAALSRSTRQLR